jgi:hypothetical protein
LCFEAATIEAFTAQRPKPLKVEAKRIRQAKTGRLPSGKPVWQLAGLDGGFSGPGMKAGARTGSKVSSDCRRIDRLDALAKQRYMR